MPYTTVTYPETTKVSLQIGPDLYDPIETRGTRVSGKVNYVRTGTNSPAAIALAKRRRSANAVYEWVPTLIRRGPKLLGYEWSKRLKKMVRRRAVSSVSWRLVRRKSTVLPKPLKGLDMPPNALDYVSIQVSYYGVKTIVAR